MRKSIRRKLMWAVMLGIGTLLTIGAALAHGVRF